MYLLEVCHRDFTLIQAGWNVGMARQLIENAGPGHVIVHRTGIPDSYYLYSKHEFLDILAGRNDLSDIEHAIPLHEANPTPAMDSFLNEALAPVRAVVLEGNRVVGFRDKPFLKQFSSPQMGGGSRGRRTTSSGAAAARPAPRSLIADFPEQVPVETTCSLLVSLSSEANSGMKLPDELSAGTMIDVIVQPRRGFRLDGQGEGSLKLDDPNCMLQFKLKAVELGSGKIIVFAFHQQKSLGSIAIAPTVVPAEEAVGERQEHRQPTDAFIQVSQPDLSLMIFEDQARKSLTFHLSALDPRLGFHMKRFGPVDLRIDPQGYFQEFFKDIEKLPLDTEVQKAIATQRLAAKGCLLFERAIPQELQAALWALRKQIKSVQIESEEPWIPWEMCKLEGSENGMLVEGPFFCEAFAMSRWLMGVGTKPALMLRKMALVLPKDSGLQNAAGEGSYLQSLAGKNRNVTAVPATYLDITKEMRRGSYDGWHFTGHGGFADSDPSRSVIVLEGLPPLMPEDITGANRNVGIPHPLIFLNACQVGRSALSLTGIGGWARCFVDAGAAAFIGAYWSVDDRAAHDFAIAFYSSLIKGVPIAMAVKEARLSIKPLADPTWLAYTVYADPSARIQS